MWPRIINVVLGIWLMVAPAVLGYGDPAQTNDRIVGPIAVSFAVIAIWGVTRPVRRVNTLLGVWLLIAPWVLGYEARAAILNNLAVGVVMIAASLVQGRITQRFGGGWSSLWRSGGAPPQQQ